MSEILKQKIRDIVERVAQAMNITCQVEVGEELRDGKIRLLAVVRVPDHAHLLLGKNGQNLQALEHLVRTSVAKESPAVSVTIDINDYKRAKASQVLEIARQAVAKVRSTRRAQALAPMSSYERRVVHMELASMPDIITESIGQDPQRRIVVKPL